MKFRAALGFFTRLPIGSAPLPPTFRGVAVWLPVVGLIIGALVSLALGLAAQLLPASLCGVIGCLVWVAVTGGLHLDGVADCGDGLIVEAPPARRLEIMKDSHIGAFSVISLALLGMLWLAAISEINRAGAFGVMCAGFMLSRVLSGISVVTFPSAKKEGLLYLFADKAQRDKVKLALYAQGILCAGFMLFCSLKGGILAIAAALGVFWYYYRKTKKELGGITGDTAGYFVVICETAILAAEAVVSIL